MYISRFTDLLTYFFLIMSMLCFGVRFKVNFQIIYPKLSNIFLSCVMADTFVSQDIK